MKDVLARFTSSLLDKYAYLLKNINKSTNENRLMIELVPLLGRVLSAAYYHEVPRAEEAASLFVETFGNFLADKTENEARIVNPWQMRIYAQLTNFERLPAGQSAIELLGQRTQQNALQDSLGPLSTA